MFRHSRQIQRVQRETYQGYVDLVRGMLADLLQAARARAARPKRAPQGTTLDLDLAAIGLTALLDGLWLEWCLEPGTFRPAQAVAMCEEWIASLIRRAQETGSAAQLARSAGA